MGAACKHGGMTVHEVMYVSAPQTVLRDRVSAVYNKVGTVQNGDRLEVLEKQKRFVRVRAAGGQEGWIELRSLVTEDTFKGFEKMAADSKQSSVQGHGVTRAQLNMHILPGRETETLYQLGDAEKVEILNRSTAERATPEHVAAARAASMAKASGENAKQQKAPARPPTRTTEKQLPPTPQKPGAPAQTGKADTALASKKGKPGSSPDQPEEEKPKVYDDWWLVRNQRGHVGWVLARMIDLDVPIEVAQYAEGQRIQGAYVLNTVQDSEKGAVPQYVVVLNEPKDGLPYDFNQVRIFTWNQKRHRYETAYRERNIMGYFPVKVGSENFGPDGINPTYIVREKGEDGSVTERKYRLIGPVVRRVLAPGEQPVKAAVVPKAKKTAGKQAAHRKHR
jgi:SH3-like domain-containing protein